MRTRAGRDLHCRQQGDPASNATGAYASAYWVALTANADAPLDTNTILVGELTGTLGRAPAAYGHTNGAGSYTLTVTATWDQSITVNKIGVFNAPAGGTMVYEDPINPAPGSSGDQTLFTITCNL